MSGSRQPGGDTSAVAAVEGPCPRCGGTGWMQPQDDPSGAVVRCSCFRSAQSGHRLAAAGMPVRYRGCTLDNFHVLPGMDPSIGGAKIRAERFIAKYPDVPYGLLFVGTAGVGKTHLAVAILRALIEEKAAVGRFADYRDLLRSIQDSYNPVSQTSELEILRPVINADVLLLDELGARRPSNWVLDTVTHVLNDRYANDRVTIVTTNYYLEKEQALEHTLTDRIGEYAVSRLHEMCRIHVMTGEDFRRRLKSASHDSDRRLDE